MPAQQLKEAIVCVYPAKLYFFGSNITDRILSLNFPTNVVKDMEIVNNEQFFILIKAFIEFYKILPVHITIIASESLCFDKSIQRIEDEHSIKFLEIFLNNIPFEHIVNGVFKVTKETKIIALNRDFFLTLKKAFEMQKFPVESVVPEFILKNTVDLKTGLDPIKAAMLIEKSYTYKAFKFHLEEKPVIMHKANPSTQSGNTQSNSSLKFLIPVLFLLIIMLVFIYSKSANQNSGTYRNINSEITGPVVNTIPPNTPFLSRPSSVPTDSVPSPANPVLSPQNLLPSPT